MNKITGLTGGPGLADKKKIHTHQQGKEIFQRELQKAKKTIGTPETGKTGASSLGEIRAVSPLMANSQSNRVEGKTMKLLDSLDNYSKALGDPAKTLKDLEPMAGDLQTQSDELSNLAGGLNEGPLKDIANESAMTAAVEYLKFHRGDHI